MNRPGVRAPGASPDDILAILLHPAAGGEARPALGPTSSPRPRNHGLPAHAVLSPKSLKEIASEAKMQSPSALSRLRRLQEQGKLQRVATTDGPRYAVLPFLRCEWIAPGHGIHQLWQSSQAVDWRFPLVSRVPDSRAQEFLMEWLDRAQARQLLPPYRSRFEKAAKQAKLLQIVVYGSCARGDAGPNSDLDILIYGEASKSQMKGLKDLAHEISLKEGRPPDVRILNPATWTSATPSFRSAISNEAKTVYASDVAARFLEFPAVGQRA